MVEPFLCYLRHRPNSDLVKNVSFWLASETPSGGITKAKRVLGGIPNYF